MALKETFPTKVADMAVIPLDWGKDKVTEGISVPFTTEATLPGTDAISDALYNRMQNNGVSEKWSRRLAERPIDALKAGMRVLGVAAMAGMVYKATGELPTHDADLLLGGNADYLLAGAGMVGGSVFGKERGEKIQTTSSEFVLQEYIDPNTLPGQVYNAHTGKVMDRSTATESTDFRVLPDMGVLYNPTTGEIDDDSWFDTTTGEIFDKDANIDPDYKVEADGRVVGPTYVPIKGNKNVAPVLDAATNEYNSNRVVDLDTGVVFGVSKGALDPSDPSAGVYDLETKLVSANNEFVDMTDNGARYEDSEKKKPVTVKAPVGVHTGKDAQGKDALDTVTTKTTKRDQATKTKWSGSTNISDSAAPLYGLDNRVIRGTTRDLKTFVSDIPRVIKSLKEDETGLTQEALHKIRESRVVYTALRKRIAERKTLRHRIAGAREKRSQNIVNRNENRLKIREKHVSSATPAETHNAVSGWLKDSDKKYKHDQVTPKKNHKTKKHASKRTERTLKWNEKSDKSKAKLA